MGAVAERYADAVVLTNDNPRTEDPQQIIDDISAGFKQPGSVHVEIDRGNAIAHALQSAGHGDIVLIAGKGHEAVQIIGSKALPFSDRERVMALAREWNK